MWGYDYDDRNRGALIGQTEDCQGSIATHLDVCEWLRDTGRMGAEEEKE